MRGQLNQAVTQCGQGSVGSDSGGHMDAEVLLYTLTLSSVQMMSFWLPREVLQWNLVRMWGLVNKRVEENVFSVQILGIC